ncbi:MAG: pyruvate, phosphate dikinase [Candidatus Woesearchaeota archaeon]
MKYVYPFEEGNKDMKEILGGKGANLAEMKRLGLPVPCGFTISIDVCKEYHDTNKEYPDGVIAQIKENLQKLEDEMGAKLGDKNNPLLVSVRSGAARSMPGMLDTILNLGLNDETVKGLINKTGNKRFAYDSYRRFIQMFGNVVLGVKHRKFEEILDNVKNTKGAKFDTELDEEDLKEVIGRYNQLIQNEKGVFPQHSFDQLIMAVDAVLNSWGGSRAIAYRKLNNLVGLKGTAVNIQVMVFGNMGDDSGTGVCFSRDPSTGEKKFYGEYLINSQGEDVVAGIRTPEPISKLKEVMPECYKQLLEIREKLEEHYKDLQDMEFTIQNGRLYLLQTRSGKRTGRAAVNIAVDMVNEGVLTKEEALMVIDPSQLDQLLHKQIDPVAREMSEFLARGLPASPGAAVGRIVFSPEEAHQKAHAGYDVILVRTETTPEDIEGMNAAKGILTARGGITSHAAVIARGMGKCCVVGCGDMVINEDEKILKIGNVELREGDYITLDGSRGEVFKNMVAVIDPELGDNFATLMGWADEVRKLKIKVNADTPKDAQIAKDFGVEGIGLCRTEHMFFEGERIKSVREMILAADSVGRKRALEKLLIVQKEDFKGLFKVMDNLPIIIRLLDPPLHEFLPKDKRDIEVIAKEMGVSSEKLRNKLADLHEFNPMLGFRGCRIGIIYPEVNEMQIKAIFEAAKEVKVDGVTPIPYIEVPLIGNVKEFKLIKDIILRVASELDLEGINYKIGAMIEVPRAAITADEIAKGVDFISFGTNDLTQMTCGFSRDDSGRFLPKYVENGIYDRDPFQSIDVGGVGKLMEICVKKAREINPEIEIGICGEHAGDPKSIEFCHKLGLDDVSCSPFRVPIARLAAAQAALKDVAD